MLDESPLRAATSQARDEMCDLNNTAPKTYQPVNLFAASITGRSVAI
jgi:hypothetical protein